MDEVVQTKLKFVVSLSVNRHSKAGIRSICNRLATENFDKLTCRPQGSMLYVGCGAGEEAVILATRVRCVITGIDVDPAILEIAKTDYPADNVECLLDDLGDISPNLPKWTGAFDKVVSIDRIKLFPEVATVLRNRVDCLKPGGEMLAIIPNNDFSFFDGAAKMIEEHPEWGQEFKGANMTIWHKTEEQAETLLRGLFIWLDVLRPWSKLASLTRRRAWLWARAEYGYNEDGTLEKSSEFMVVYGVKKN